MDKENGNQTIMEISMKECINLIKNMGMVSIIIQTVASIKDILKRIKNKCMESFIFKIKPFKKGIGALIGL